MELKLEDAKGLRKFLEKEYFSRGQGIYRAIIILDDNACNRILSVRNEKVEEEAKTHSTMKRNFFFFLVSFVANKFLCVESTLGKITFFFFRIRFLYRLNVIRRKVIKNFRTYVRFFFEKWNLKCGRKKHLFKKSIQSEFY